MDTICFADMQFDNKYIYLTNTSFPSEPNLMSSKSRIFVSQEGCNCTFYCLLLTIAAFVDKLGRLS